jgi:hypothetical protein
MLEQSSGIPFDSTDFTMITAPTGILFSMPCTLSMEELEEEEEVEFENDPDLEDGDDTFEQYLFGEDGD